MTLTSIPVLIAGGGPVGMTVALDLARRGIRCTLVEKNENTTRHPKMDVTNSRSMELFRGLGIIPELRAAALPASQPFDVSWITSFAGYELARFRYPNVDQVNTGIKEKNDGTQPLEAPMRVSQVEIEPVLKTAAENHPLIDVRFGVAFESLVQDETGVTVTLNRSEDKGHERVRCEYLIGCDGGNSVVRRCLDIGLTGDSHVMDRFMTHFKSDRRDVLQRWGAAWHYQSAVGTLIAQNDRDTWTLHTRFPDAVGEFPDPSALIRQFTGVDIDHEILVANPWIGRLVVADKYRKGRVLLAGDAVHQYIPTGGYGMNTGIGDAFDVAWKVAAVLSGFGGSQLLDSYEAERRPIGIRNCAGSRRHNDTRKQIGALYHRPLEEQSSAGAASRAYVGERIRAIGNAENESRGIEMGYIYANSPIVYQETGVFAPLDPINYVPSTVPGARLPSIFLQDDSPLYDHLGEWFTLLDFGSNGESCGLLASAAKELNIPLKIVRIGDQKLLSIYEAPIILVRPDHHVAWRGSRIDNSAVAKTILLKVLGWE